MISLVSLHPTGSEAGVEFSGVCVCVCDAGAVCCTAASLNTSIPMQRCIPVHTPQKLCDCRLYTTLQLLAAKKTQRFYIEP